MLKKILDDWEREVLSDCLIEAHKRRDASIIMSAETVIDEAFKTHSGTGMLNYPTVLSRLKSGSSSLPTGNGRSVGTR